MTKPTIRFSAININHNHIYGMVRLLLRAGAEFVSFYAPEPDLIAEFSQAFPQARLASSAKEILEDASIQMVLTSGIASERAPLGIQVMKHGKDFMSDKPGFTTLEQLAEARRVQAETKRIYSICFSERLEVRSAVHAGDLIKAGAIGKVIQTVGLGPHRIHPPVRPDWFFQRAKYGGILTDIASHQVEQFLYYTGSTSAEVVTSQVANWHHPQYPELEDFGDMVLRSDQGTGYIRVDWFTPQGLGQWGDGRMTILGTDGYIELRKYIDIAGKPGADHLFLVDQKGIQYIDCSQYDLPYGAALISDVWNRTETAMPQAHVFLTSQLALEAEAKAQKLGYLK
jgi:predicted dehydrogenase